MSVHHYYEGTLYISIAHAREITVINYKQLFLLGKSAGGEPHSQWSWRVNGRWLMAGISKDDSIKQMPGHQSSWLRISDYVFLT